MAVFSSTNPGSTFADPQNMFDLGKSLQTAQTIQGNSQSLALNQQKVLDQQQEVALRPAIAAGNPNALSTLASIDPSQADAQLQYRSTVASVPLARANAVQGFQAMGARAVALSTNPKQAYEGPGGYVEHMASLGIQVPPTYDPSYVQGQAYSGLSGDDYTKLQMTIPQTPGVNGVPGGAGGAAPPAAAPTGLFGAFAGQESGGNPNAPTSVNGARGQYQITPGTFAQYAKPGEKIDNATDNAAVGQRILTAYNQQYGGDPARVAVAYFSGPGNVAPPGSPTPYLQDKADGNGVKTSQYVSGILGRMGLSGVPGASASTQQTPEVGPGSPPGPVPQNSLSTVVPGNTGMSATPLGGYTPGSPADVAAQQQQPAQASAPPSIDVSASTPPGQAQYQYPTQALAVLAGAPETAGAPTPDVGQPLPPSVVGVSTGPLVATGDDGHPVAPSTVTLPGGQTVQAAPSNRYFVHTFVGGQPLVSKDGNSWVGYNEVPGQAPVPATQFVEGRALDPLHTAAVDQIQQLTKEGYTFTVDPQTQLPQITGARPGSVAAAGGQIGMAKTQAGIDIQSKAAEAQNSAAAQGPGALLQPQPNGDLPLPPVDPMQGVPNNAAGEDRYKQLTGDAVTQMSKDSDISEGLQEDAENAQHFMDISKGGTVTGPLAGAIPNALRAAGLTADGPGAYQMLNKYAAQMQTSGLPKGFSRLDIPIVKAVAAAQPGVTNVNAVNNSIASMKVARDQRQLQYINARQDYAAIHNGVVAGFDRMWNDYNANVPTTRYVDPRAALPGGQQYAKAGLTVNDAAPSFQQWASLRADPQTGRYQPSWAQLTDGQVQQLKNPPAATPVGQQPTVQQAAATSPSPAATTPPIPPAAVAMLHAHPEWAANFDQTFGAGASKVVLGQ